MPKTKRSAPPTADASGLVSTESPVPGVNLELALLLVQAVKARRKYLSKKSSADEALPRQKNNNALPELQNSADDKTTAFLNELRRQLERSAASAAASKTNNSASRYNNGKKKPTTTNNAPPTSCLEFLLETLSDDANSFHLRRAALALSRDILERSSDARAYLTRGKRLLDFISVVEGAENDHRVAGIEVEVVNADEQNNNGEGRGDQTTTTSTASGSNNNSMPPGELFQFEAMELLHHLAFEFGRFYAQFAVASRLLGDVSINFSMNSTSVVPNANGTTQAGGGGRGRGQRSSSQRVNMRMLRRERDVALEHGAKACQSLDRMIERADACFRVLVPRFGGFNAGIRKELTVAEDGASVIDATADSKPAVECKELQSDNNENGVDRDEDDDDDDSIDWEEGDIDLSDTGDCNEDTNQTAADCHNDKETNNQPTSIDHQAAVEHTMKLMGRAGALLDGNLAVNVGAKCPDAGPKTKNTAPAINTDSTIATTLQPADALATARTKLQKLVQKLSAQRLPRLNRWIHALSRADGMEERAVTDPVTGNEGPVSLVLLSEEKRAMRGQLLRRLLKIRGEIEDVLKPAATLGIIPEGSEKERNDNGGADSHSANGSPTGNAVMARMKRPWMPGTENLAMALASKKKKPKTSRFKVVYRRK